MAEWPRTSDAAQLTALLFRVGDRLGEALDGLPRERRSDVRQTAGRGGQAPVPPGAGLPAAAGRHPGSAGRADRRRPGQTFGGDKLLDLLAGLVVEEGLDTRRLSEVYARFATVGKTEDFLAAVREKMGTGGTGEFTSEVWGAVESFLLSLQESPFMGSDYSATLEHVAAAELQEQVQGVDLTGDLEPHLDAVLVGLAIHDARPGGPAPRNAWSSASTRPTPGPCSTWPRNWTASDSALLGTRPDLVERLFHRCSRQVRALDDGAAQRPRPLRPAPRGRPAGARCSGPCCWRSRSPCAAIWWTWWPRSPPPPLPRW